MQVDMYATPMLRVELYVCVLPALQLTAPTKMMVTMKMMTRTMTTTAAGCWEVSGGQHLAAVKVQGVVHLMRPPSRGRLVGATQLQLSGFGAQGVGV